MTDQLSLVFSALADPTRRDIVARLTEGDATVNELAQPYDVSVQAISKHLKVLGDAGLVSRGTSSAEHLAEQAQSLAVAEIHPAQAFQGQGDVPAGAQAGGQHGRG